MSPFVVSFGEIMGRFAAPQHMRLRQTHALEVTYAGAEASVAASICNFGGSARFVTALPKHALAEATLDSLRAVGIDTQFVRHTDEGRLGLYFLESGANQRPSNVIYDREHSAVSITEADQYDWDAIFDGAQWLHLSGITSAISRCAANANLVAAQKAKQAGLQVSVDLNFRAKLWTWDKTISPRELARQTMRNLLPHVDLVIANEDDCSNVLGIHAKETDVHAGTIQSLCYPEVAAQVVEQFPSVSRVAITLRESHSATHNNWGAMLLDVGSGESYFSPTSANGEYRPYEIKSIVDRVGSGDAFAAGLIYCLTTPELSKPQTALAFAVAASCLKHSIHGDFNCTTRNEVELLMTGNASGRVLR